MPLSIDTPHPEISYWSNTWALCEDATRGSRAIKAKGQTYLPGPFIPDEIKGTDEEARLLAGYERYKGRAVWYAATGYTVDVYRGLAFRKPPERTIADDMADWSKNVNGKNQSLDQFASGLLRRVIISNWGGILIDNTEAAAGKSRATVDARQLWPRVSVYGPGSVLDWPHAGDAAPRYVLKEQYYDSGRRLKDRYRELTLIDGVYKQILHEGDNQRVVEVRDSNGQQLDYIPFRMVTDHGLEQITEPMISGVATLNVAHYVNSADHEQAIHYSCSPIYTIAGVQRKLWPDRVAGGEIWGAEDSNAKFGILLPGGGAIAPVAHEMKEKEHRMASIGVSNIVDRADPTATGAHIRNTGQTSMLASGCNSTSAAMAWAIDVAIRLRYGRRDDKSVYNVLTDFNAQRMSPQEIQALLQSVLARRLSTLSFIEALQEGEVVGTNRTAEEEMELIEREGAAEDAGLTP